MEIMLLTPLILLLLVQLPFLINTFMPEFTLWSRFTYATAIATYAAINAGYIAYAGIEAGYTGAYANEPNAAGAAGNALLV